MPANKNKTLLIFTSIILLAVSCNNKIQPTATIAPQNPPITAAPSAGSSQSANPSPTPSLSPSPSSSTLADGEVVLSQAQLLAMAGNKYADGNLPLGDGKYVTAGPKTGYIYLCRTQMANMNMG